MFIESITTVFLNLQFARVHDIITASRYTNGFLFSERKSTITRKDSIVLSAFIFAGGCGAFCAVRKAASANDTLFAQFASGEGFSRGGSIDEIDYTPVDPEGNPVAIDTPPKPVGRALFHFRAARASRKDPIP